MYSVDGLQMSVQNTVSGLADGSTIQSPTHTLRHLNHCYDALLQAIMCRADDTPLYAPKNTFFAEDGRPRRCRNWNTLQDWAIRLTACYDPV